ncbi:hypothetical protein TSUD_337670 [Trifolium subterraneum]|uniref:Uncharacterized protein n=1 Tax=Trifolium subterraneum TaxID=3900 RepID=A0A2Z6MD98_TRISU|nr:hypothetical protein TSUD_337670 [Trifolium subterraneum]
MATQVLHQYNRSQKDKNSIINYVKNAVEKSKLRSEEEKERERHTYLSNRVLNSEETEKDCV